MTSIGRNFDDGKPIRKGRDVGDTQFAQLPVSVEVVKDGFDWSAMATISNTIFCLLSLAIVVISIWVAISTLKQNSKMIEDSTRPYIGLTGEHVNNSATEYKLVLKNYGSTEAFIREIEFVGVNLRGSLPVKTDREPFEHLVGSSVLPSQSFICILNGAIVDDLPHNIETRIKYDSSAGKTYESTFNVPLGAYCDIPSGRVYDRKEPYKTIAFTLQTIADKML